MRSGIIPTVVLVHGAFADASHWAPVIRRLQARGIPVHAPPIPLRGLTEDAAFVTRYVDAISGPVVLVGHSYGVAVISAAGDSARHAVGLVYVAAWILDDDEAFGDLAAGFAPTPLGSVLRTSAGAETSPAARRSWAGLFDERPRGAAWRTLPSWAVVATNDHVIDAGAQRHMAHRAGAETVEVPASHAIARSHPPVLVRAIAEATETTATEEASRVLSVIPAGPS